MTWIDLATQLLLSCQISFIDDNRRIHISAKMYFAVALILALFNNAVSLRCYDCFSTVLYGGCDDPFQPTVVPLVDCESNRSSSNIIFNNIFRVGDFVYPPNGNNYRCMAIKIFTSNGILSGTGRSCMLVDPAYDFCTYLDLGPEYVVSSCYNCSTNNCNSRNFDF